MSETTDSPVQPESAPSLTDRLAGLLQADGLIDAPEPDSQPGAAEDPEDTEPVEAASDADEAPEAEAKEPDSQPDAEDEGTEEVEVDGKQYRVPRELKDHLMRDRDYRHKTMEIAEERKALQQVKPYIEQAYQAATQMPQIVGGITSVEQQLAQYEKVNWQELKQNDPVNFNTLQLERRNLIDQRSYLYQQFNDGKAKIDHAKAAEFAQEVAKNEPIVRKAIKDWGPEKQKELLSYAAEKHGYKPDELAGLTDARAVVILSKAMEYDKLLAQRASTAKKVTTVAPVAKPQRSPGPDVDYQKALNRLKKTGSAEDALVALRLQRRG